MNFLEKYEEKLLPSFHKTRYNIRVQRVLKLKQKWLTRPKDLTYDEVRITLKILQFKKLLPSDPKHQELQSKFARKSVFSFIPAIAVSMIPFLIKQFHALNKYKKYGTCGVITLLCYFSQIKDAYEELDAYNRQIGRKYIPFLKEQEQQ